jgi:putative ABC transport system permease protein
MLGIIIGVAAVIIIVALGQGMANDMKETFQSMGTNLLTVNLRGRGSSRTITPDQIYEFTEENSDTFAGVTPLVSISSATVKYGDTSLDTTTVTGVGENFCSIKNYAVASGRFLQYIDIARRQKVCVIGAYVAQELFSGSDPVGETIRLNGEEYQVIGVLEEKASSEESTDD